MKEYRKEYMQLISEAKKLQASRFIDRKNGKIYHKHHILPKGKNFFPLWKDRKSNCVLLTPEEHINAHRLLAKIYGAGMYLALFRLLKNSKNADTLEAKELRAKIANDASIRLKKQWQDPDYREAKIASYKKGWQNSPNKKNINIGREYPSRRIAVINLDTNEEYLSIGIAEKETGIRHIGDVIKGRRPLAGGYRWAFLEESKRVPYVKPISKKIIVNIDNEEKIFYKQTEVAEYFNVTPSYVSVCIKNNKKLLGKYTIRRINEN